MSSITFWAARTPITSLLLVGGLSAAHGMDAGTLNKYCQTDIASAGDYIMGVLDKYNDDRIIIGGIVEPEMKGNPAYSIVKNTIGDFCYPANANVAAAIVIGCKWLKEHPEKGRIPASNALVQAYSEAWACK